MSLRVPVLTVLAALLALAFLLSWRDELPDVEIRYSPRQTHSGKLFPGHALGQGLQCEFDGLRAIDVALVRIGGGAPATPIELLLHAGSPDGPIVRRVRREAAELPLLDGWTRFEFEPVEDSGGANFWFELSSDAPSGHSPWVRCRGIPFVVRSWLAGVLHGPTIEGELTRESVPHPDLRAVAIAVDGLDSAAVPATLTLSDPQTGAVLRRSELAPRAPWASGWVFFSFEPLHESRFQRLHYRFDLPPEARVIGDERGPAMILFHSTAEADPRLFGLSWHGRRFADRDLVFRAWTDQPTTMLVSRLQSRGHAALALAALCWIAAVVTCFRATRRASDEMR